METRRLDLGGLDVAVLEAGAGGRPLLVVHGFTGAKEDFADHLSALADEGWHVVAPDLRGHGESAKPPDEAQYSLKQYATDQLALVDALGWDRFALLGHSMGGMLTQLVALEVPDRVRAYVLMDTCPASLRGLDPDLMAAAVSVVREQGIDALADISAGAEGPLDTPATLRLKEERPGYEDWCDAKLRACSPAMYAAMVTEIADQEDRLPRFGELTMPTLVMVGEQDRPFRKASQRMHDALSDSRLVVFPDAGHSPQLENPAAWYEALTGFLREAGA